jgi:hypothetical protein
LEFDFNKTTQSNIAAGNNVTGRDDNSVTTTIHNINAPVIFKADANLSKLVQAHELEIEKDPAYSGCHSLGTLTCNNLVGRGYAPSAQLNSLPFGNIAIGKNALMTNLGQLDIVNGGWLGRIFNPVSTSTPCLDGGTSGMFCHGWDANYRPIQNGGE